MITVPAQILRAPARARSIAALRSMPGDCGVLGSSECAGITRTPSCFHLGSLVMPASYTFRHPRERGDDRILDRRSLPPPRRAGEALGFFGGTEQGLGLVDAFLLLGFRVGIGDDAGAGLHIHGAVLDQRGA